jgi:hypothetical protein
LTANTVAEASSVCPKRGYTSSFKRSATNAVWPKITEFAKIV